MSAWIRGPRYDGIWFLSGIPLGVILLLVSVWTPSFISLCSAHSVVFVRPMGPLCDPMRIMASLISIYAVVLFDTGHSLAPICLAWIHRGFRAHMLSKPIKFIALPLALLAAGTLSGIYAAHYFPQWTPFVNSAMQASEMYPPRVVNPFWWIVAIYVAWNLYHFGKQNFGMLSLYRLRSRVAYPANQRSIDLVFGFAVQAAIFVSAALPLLVKTAAAWETAHILLFGLVVALILITVRDAAISRSWWTPRILFAISQSICILMPGMMTIASNGINHWLTSIGLAAHIDGESNRRSPAFFYMIVIILGFAVFCLFFWKRGTVYSWNLRDMIHLALPYAGARLALGYVHFLYDRWLYKKDGRAILGARLFSGDRTYVLVAAE